MHARRTSAWCRRSGATSMPWRAKILASYFMFWPIFRTAGSSSTGFSIASASSSGICPSASSSEPKRSSVPPCLVGQRDVAGLARLDAERDADQVGGHLVQRRWSRYRPPPSRARGSASIQACSAVGARGRTRRSPRSKGAASGASALGLGRRPLGDRRRLDAQLVGDAPGEGAELHLGQEGQQRARGRVRAPPDRRARSPAACRSRA